MQFLIIDLETFAGHLLKFILCEFLLEIAKVSIHPSQPPYKNVQYTVVCVWLSYDLSACLIGDINEQTCSANWGQGHCCD